MKTKLYISHNSSAGVLLKGQEIELSDDVVIEVNSSISDLQNPEKRKSEYTKSIEVAGTESNNELFSSIFRLDRTTLNTTATNFQPDFNPNLKADCVIEIDGINVLRGYLQLESISIVDDHKIEYSVVFFGRSANLLLDLGDKQLSDLDLSDYDHIWSMANVVSSWTAPIGVGFVYPLIDRGYDPLETTYYLDQSYPSVYVKTLVDKIFKAAGYRYSSAFFETDRFKRLILAYGGDGWRMSANRANDKLLKIEYSADTIFTAPTPATALIDFDLASKNTVPSGISLSKFICPATLQGKYTFRVELSCQAKNNSGSTIPDMSFYFMINIVIKSGGVTRSLANAPIFIGWHGSVAANATKDFNISLQTPETYISPTDEVYATWTLIPFPSVYNNQRSYYLVKFKQGSALFNGVDGIYSSGDLVYLASALPTDFSQAELLKCLIAQFNLYMEPDKIDSKKLIIEPRDSFYTGTVVDISHKIDVSKGVVLSPMGALEFKTLEMAYTRDEDDLNKAFNDRYVDTYGSRRIEINNDFLVEKKRVELKLAPTLLGSHPLSNRIISKIRFFDDAGAVKNKAAKPRMLYYGGLRDCTQYMWGDRPVGSGTVTTVRTQYPYAGHLDNPTDPTFDLGFGIPKAIFYGASTNPKITDANLYNIYWKKSIDEITDKDSKIAECYLHMNAAELASMSYRFYYFFDKQYFRLHSLEYNSNGDEPVKAQFLKIKTAPLFVASSGIGNGGVGSIGSEMLPSNNDYNRLITDKLKDEGVISVKGVTNEAYASNGEAYFTDSKVYLPDPLTAVKYSDQKTQEINVINTGTSPITVVNEVTGKTMYIEPLENAILRTDGVEWYKTGGSGEINHETLISAGAVASAEQAAVLFGSVLGGITADSATDTFHISAAIKDSWDGQDQQLEVEFFSPTNIAVGKTIVFQIYWRVLEYGQPYGATPDAMQTITYTAAAAVSAGSVLRTEFTLDAANADQPLVKDYGIHAVVYRDLGAGTYAGTIAVTAFRHKWVANSASHAE